jgi:TonB-linked SusC/RagA family outer membrane protein
MHLQRLLKKMMLPILLLMGLAAFAQDKTITGKVTDSKTGAPLQGISVTVKGKGIGVQTAADGSFTLKVPAGTTTLEISSIGYTTKEVAISAIANIGLVEASVVGTDVVVIGYGTVRKKDLTGSVTTVTAKDFNQGAISTPDQLIQGKIAGVVVTPNSGQPGVGSTIRIRGGSSLSASNDPLIVIDGVPMSNSTVNGASSPLSLINSDDIETFTVLKDASATAIYGNRASNGVIIITTKKGRSSAFHVNVSSVNSLAKAAGRINVLTGDQIRSIVKAKGTAAQQAILGTANTDWQSQIYQQAFTTDNNISFTGGIKGLPYRLTVGYLGQDGILKTSYLKRTSTSLNLSPSFLDNHLKVDVNLKGIIADNRFANANAVADAVRMDPTQTVTATGFGKYGGYWETLDNSSTTVVPNSLATRNPVGELMAKRDVSTVKRAIGNIQLDYKIPFLPELHANVNAGLDVSRSNGSVTIDPTSAIGYNNGGSYNSYTQYNRNKLFDFYLNYTKDLKGIDSRIDVTAGYEYQDFYRAAPATTTYSILGTSPATGNTVTPVVSLPDSTQNTLVSFYGRLNYSYKGRYLLTATLRRDGSSRFAPNNHWGNFPAVALGWKIKDEAFLKNSNIVSDLKLRVSYGKTGNQDISSNYYPYYANYTASTATAGYSFGNTSYVTYRGAAYDANIKWEQTATYDAGLDYGFFKNKIYGSIDLYTRKTSDLISTVPVAAGANLSNYVVTNVGDLTSKGAEFSINANIIANKKINWTAGFNITYNEYKITSLGAAGTTIPVGTITGGTGNNIQMQAVGFTRNVFYLEKQVYNASGAPVEGSYANVNNSTSNYFYYGKSPDPRFTLGFNSQFSYTKWSLGFSMHGSLGNYLYNNVRSNSDAYVSVLDPNHFIANATTDLLKTNFANRQYFSDYYLEKASFLRMDNIVLGYDFGRLKNKMNLRVSAIVQNPFIITKYSGLDPEIPTGIDNNLYPKSRVYSFGVNLGF